MNDLVNEKDEFKQLEELKVEKYNFSQALNRIREFSRTSPQTIKLPKVSTTESSFIFFSKNHEVTGSELNDVTSKIQKNLVGFNDAVIKLIREFDEIYKTIDYLDKEYINAICLTLKGVLKNHNILHDSLVLQKKVVIELNKFKEKLNQNKHIAEVDDLWDLTYKLLDSHNQLIETVNQYDELINKLGMQYDELSKQQLYVSELKQNLQEIKQDNEAIKIYVSQQVSGILKNIQDLDVKHSTNEVNLENKVNDLEATVNMLQNKLNTVTNIAYAAIACSIVAIGFGIFGKL